MNRRRFIELLGMAAVGARVAYSFPRVIVPRLVASRARFRAGARRLSAPMRK